MRRVCSPPARATERKWIARANDPEALDRYIAVFVEAIVKRQLTRRDQQLDHRDDHDRDHHGG
jgi:hypothetical protein